MIDITPRQKRILDFIREYLDGNGHPPTTRDIAGHFGFSAKAAHDHLHALEKKGYIRVTPRVPRGIKVLR